MFGVGNAKPEPDIGITTVGVSGSSLVSVKASALRPMLVGENDTVIAHSSAGDSCEQLWLTVKLVVSMPDTEILLTLRFAVPLLLAVIVSVSDWPTVVAAKSNVMLSRLRSGIGAAVAFPDNDTLTSMLSRSLELIVRVALRSPCARGAKVTVIAQSSLARMSTQS